MKSSIKNITPTQAKKWLDETNIENRRMNPKRVHQYACDMASGAWVLSPQGIAFDDTERLIDGQNRLQAIVESGVTVKMVVWTDVPKSHRNGVLQDIRDVFDRGQPRSIGQQLQLSHGYKNANNMASAAKVIVGICTGNHGGGMSTAQTLKVLSLYGPSIEAVFSCPWSKLMRKAPLIGTLSFAMSVDSARVIEFSNKLATMESVPSRSAIHALHRWIQNHGIIANASNRNQFCRVVASCVTRHLDGRSADKVIGSEEALDTLRNAQKSKVRQVCEIMGVA